MVIVSPQIPGVVLFPFQMAELHGFFWMGVTVTNYLRQVGAHPPSRPWKSSRPVDQTKWLVFFWMIHVRISGYVNLIPMLFTQLSVISIFIECSMNKNISIQPSKLLPMDQWFPILQANFGPLGLSHDASCKTHPKTGVKSTPWN